MFDAETAFRNEHFFDEKLNLGQGGFSVMSHCECLLERISTQIEILQFLELSSLLNLSIPRYRFRI